LYWRTPIKKGCGFVFESGVLHETKNTGDALKLLVGTAGKAVGVLATTLLTLTTTPSNVLLPTNTFSYSGIVLF
jgi:hypothetical protein